MYHQLLRIMFVVGILGSICSIGAAAVINDDFNDNNMDNWSPKIGSWSANNGTLVNNGSPYGVILHDDSLGAYQYIETDAFFDMSSSSVDQKIAHLRLRMTENNSGSQPYWDTGYLAEFQLGRISIQNTFLGGNPYIKLVQGSEFTDNPFTQSGWYKIGFEVMGIGADTSFKLFIDGIEYLNADYNNTIGQLDQGYAGLGRKIEYDNVLIRSSDSPVPEPTAILLVLFGGVRLMKKRIR